ERDGRPSNPVPLGAPTRQRHLCSDRPCPRPPPTLKGTGGIATDIGEVDSGLLTVRFVIARAGEEPCSEDSAGDREDKYKHRTDSQHPFPFAVIPVLWGGRVPRSSDSSVIEGGELRCVLLPAWGPTSAGECFLDGRILIRGKPGEQLRIGIRMGGDAREQIWSCP